MTQILEATFDGVVFRPDEKVEIKPNTRVRLVVKVEGEAEQTIADVAGHLFGAIETDAPADVSTNKKYLEGFGE